MKATSVAQLTGKWKIMAVRIISLASALLAAGAVSAASAEGATGRWIMANGKITVQISPCGGNLCGVIVAMKKPLDKHGRPKRDKDNPNPALRNRPVIGSTVLSNMKPGGEDRWAGEIYNADDGNTYNSYMSLDGDTMKVKGCVAFICKKMSFSRVN